MKTIISVILSLLLFKAPAQIKPASFALIDKKIKSVHSSDADSLTRKLTSPYKTDTEKVRAIFRWITENIAYDIKGYHNTKELYGDLWELSLAANETDVKSEYNKRIVQKVLKEKRAVCDGYSRLFKTLCDYAGVQCEIITGYIRWSSDPIGEMTNRGHAWNAVYINGSWKLIDVTWASGYSNNDVTEFTKFYNDFFFFTDPVAFFNDHFPTDNKWSLLPNTPSLYEFYNFPFYYPDFYKFRITSLNPTSGYIEVTQRSRLVRIEVETIGTVKDFYVYEYPFENIDADTGKSQANADSLFDEETAELDIPKYKFENGRITCSYEIRSDKAQKLNVFYNGKLILAYGIRFRK